LTISYNLGKLKWERHCELDVFTAWFYNTDAVCGLADKVMKLEEGIEKLKKIGNNPFAS